MATEPQSRVQVSLPEEENATATVREVALVVLIPFLVLLGVNAVVSYALHRHPSNRGYAVTQQKWEMLTNLKAKVDTLVLGDSSCGQGVRPELLAKRFGGRALNLCTTGTSIVVGGAWMAGAYIERWGKPERIIVMHAYDVWERDDEKLRKTAWVFGAQRGLFFGRRPLLGWSMEERVLLHIGSLVPLYTEPSAALDFLLHPKRELGRAPVKLSKGGFMARTGADPHNVQADAKKHSVRNSERQFQMSEPNRAAIVEIVRLSKEHDLDLFVAHAPLYAGLWKDDRTRSYHQQVSSYLGLLLKDAPKAHLLFREPVLFKESDMESVDHITGRKAPVTLTERLITAIEQAGHRAP